MYEYAWAPGGPGPGYSSGYYVGILQYNSTKGLGYFLTTQYNSNPCSSNLCTSGYYDYYYLGSGWSTSYNLTCPLGCPNLNYYFLEDKTGTPTGYWGSNYFAFMPPDQQNDLTYYQYGVFWLYNWFQADNNMNIFFLMNGNIFNYSLALEQYKWKCNCGLFGCSTCKAYAILPNPPTSTNTITGEPIFVQSYINAYNTALNQPRNRQRALYNYQYFNPNDIDVSFIPGTFGYKEIYNTLSQPFYINYLQDDTSVYVGTPYLFVSAGSGGGPGFMYLNWIIVTYGVPYIVNVS
jgi:hypothetical protein